MSAPTLTQQCVFIDTELRLRKVVYAKAVAAGEISQAFAMDRLAHMQAVQETVVAALAKQTEAERPTKSLEV